MFKREERVEFNETWESEEKEWQGFLKTPHWYENFEFLKFVEEKEDTHLEGTVQPLPRSTNGELVVL